MDEPVPRKSVLITGYDFNRFDIYIPEDHFDLQSTKNLKIDVAAAASELPSRTLSADGVIRNQLLT